MKKKRPSIFATFAELSQGYAASAVAFDAISDLDRIETFGTLDYVMADYDGNKMTELFAITEALPFDGVTGLHADGEFELA